MVLIEAEFFDDSDSPTTDEIVEGLPSRLGEVVSVYLSESVAVAKIEVPPFQGGLRYNPFCRELTIPPRYVHQYQNIDNEMAQVLAMIHQSEINIHERTHDRVTQRESHQYLNPRLNSYTVTLSATSSTQDDEYEQVLLGLFTCASDAASRMLKSKLFHEGIAIEAQRNFLQEQENTGDLARIIERLDYQKHVDHFLGQRTDTESLELPTDSVIEQYPEHVFGHWLYRRTRSIWNIDIHDYAFRFIGHLEMDLPEHIPMEYDQADDDRVAFGRVGPDVVLLEAALVNEELIDSRSEPDQARFLKHLIRRNERRRVAQNSNLNFPDQLSEDDVVIATRKTIRERMRKRRLERAWTAKQPTSLPILSTRYPGDNREQPRHLWRLLESFHTVTLPTGDRYLFLQSREYQWARETKLLDLAIGLWARREHLFMPFFRHACAELEYDRPALLKSIEENNPPSDGVPLTGDHVKPEQAAEDVLEPFNSFLRSEHDEFVSNLTHLGKSIRQRDEDEIISYISR